jgi:hypothetical protein
VSYDSAMTSLQAKPKPADKGDGDGKNPGGAQSRAYRHDQSKSVIAQLSALGVNIQALVDRKRMSTISPATSLYLPLTLERVSSQLDQ